MSSPDNISSDSNVTIENRAAYRIDDNILLSLRVIPDDKVEDVIKRFPEVYAELQLLNQFTDTSNALTDQFALVRRRYPEVAKYLELLDQKINTLSRRQFAVCSVIPDLRWYEVNLSAGGLRFSHEEKIEVGSFLEMRLQMSPVSSYILAYGKVVRCEVSEESDKKYIIAAEYSHMDPEDREAIHTHVRGKEMKLIRKKHLL